MRDPERIDKILGLLRKYWKANPDLRLAQIVGNMSGMQDPYNYEDDDLIKALEKEDK